MKLLTALTLAVLAGTATAAVEPGSKPRAAAHARVLAGPGEAIGRLARGGQLATASELGDVVRTVERWARSAW